MTATTPKSRKGKGRNFQKVLRDDLIRILNINPLDIESTGMGQSGCDIKLSLAARRKFPYGVEAKWHETVTVWPWLLQTEENAREEHLRPLLAFKYNYSPRKGVVYVVMDREEFQWYSERPGEKFYIDQATSPLNLPNRMYRVLRKAKDYSEKGDRRLKPALIITKENRGCYVCWLWNDFMELLATHGPPRGR